MIKFWLLKCSLIFFGCSFIGLAYAYSESTQANTLQTYRDEIKQSESNASQAMLDALKAHAPDNSPQQDAAAPLESSTTTSTPRSNNDKAFMPSDKSTDLSHSSNKNPWLKSNPWAKKPPNIWEENAKVNPYSNAPIPGPTPSTNLITPNPPNIFTPSRPTPNTSNPQPNANS